MIKGYHRCWIVVLYALNYLILVSKLGSPIFPILLIWSCGNFLLLHLIQFSWSNSVLWCSRWEVVNMLRLIWGISNTPREVLLEGLLVVVATSSAIVVWVDSTTQCCYTRVRWVCRFVDRVVFFMLDSCGHIIMLLVCKYFNWFILAHST